ncbi:hypothetical protein SEA_KARDASHIAN_1 [Streptomyces phage Kardashian]|nr:hypothetical protein SEA_KARDASHIAN_1 [Streptomyces phage Kardashian]
MVARRQPKPLAESGRRRAATTPEARESQMISLAERLAEQQMRDGTASAQVITHYLKLGSTRERLEQDRLKGEVELQKAKIEAMASTQRLEEMYTRAMDAFRGYQGHPPPEDDEDA